MTSEERSIASQNRVKKTKEMPPEVFSVWKHYEDKADRLGEQLWTVGVWLIALVGATLSLPFVAGFLRPLGGQPRLQIENRVAVAMLWLFGILLCCYSYFALRDLRDHVQSNWRNAGYVLEGTWKYEWRGRKSHGWSVLLGIGILAFAGFVTLLILAISGA